MDIYLNQKYNVNYNAKLIKGGKHCQTDVLMSDKNYEKATDYFSCSNDNSLLDRMQWFAKKGKQ